MNVQHIEQQWQNTTLWPQSRRPYSRNILVNGRKMSNSPVKVVVISKCLMEEEQNASWNGILSPKVRSREDPESLKTAVDLFQFCVNFPPWYLLVFTKFYVFTPIQVDTCLTSLGPFLRFCEGHCKIKHRWTCRIGGDSVIATLVAYSLKRGKGSSALLRQWIYTSSVIMTWFRKTALNFLTSLVKENFYDHMSNWWDTNYGYHSHTNSTKIVNRRCSYLQLIIKLQDSSLFPVARRIRPIALLISGL